MPGRRLAALAALAAARAAPSTFKVYLLAGQSKCEAAGRGAGGTGRDAGKCYSRVLDST
jgi:hypothetical protein